MFLICYFAIVIVCDAIFFLDIILFLIVPYSGVLVTPHVQSKSLQNNESTNILKLVYIILYV